MNSNESVLNPSLTIKNNISACVHCGRCKSLCPTYLEISTELFGARGRVTIIRKFKQGEIIASKRLYESIFSCVLCEACNKICPLNIDIANAIYESRKSLKNFNRKAMVLNYFLRLAFMKPSTTFRIVKILRTIGFISKSYSPSPLRYLKKFNITPADKALRETGSVFKVTFPKGRIAIFAGCIINYLNPSYGNSLIKILNRLKYDVILPSGEVCCGAPLLELGLEDDYLKLAKKNIETFNSLNVEAIISLCPTCIHFIKNIYKSYLGDSIDKALDISQFLTLKSSRFKELIKPYKSLSVINHQNKVIFHDPCHAKYSLNILSEPRYVLKQAGINLIEPLDHGCCGFGGTFGLFFESLSEEILNRRVDSYSQADTIITSCPNCILQLKRKIKDAQVIHIIDILAEIIGKENE